ncbi:MAG: DUF484 family protein [Alphaproteobacteria bacterium]|nr:DUF484 family protein [Alphaproteobacteria bacterium]
MTQKAKSIEVLKSKNMTFDQVKSYLKDNPEFFLKDPGLLTSLKFPAREFNNSEESDSDIVDLQQFVLNKLRLELDSRRRENCDLIDSRRANLRDQSRINATVLRLLSARSLDHLIELISTDMLCLLDVDSVALCFETGINVPATCSGIRVLPNGMVQDILGGERNVSLLENISGDRSVFGEQSSLICSAAFIRLILQKDGPPALLALGSRETTRFHSRQGTELFAFLAHIVEHSISLWLDLPR